MLMMKMKDVANDGDGDGDDVGGDPPNPRGGVVDNSVAPLASFTDSNDIIRRAELLDRRRRRRQQQQYQQQHPEEVGEGLVAAAAD